MGTIRAILFLLLFGITLSAPAADEAAYEEEEVKAALVFNLIKFVEWPQAILKKDMPLQLCYSGIGLGQEKAFAALEGKLVGTSPVLLRWVQQASNLAGCHVWIVGTGKMPSPLAQHLPEYGILTIGENGFIDRGGMVGLVMADGRLSLEFNLEKLHQSGISIPAKVLRLAKRVKGI